MFVLPPASSSSQNHPALQSLSASQHPAVPSRHVEWEAQSSAVHAVQTLLLQYSPEEQSPSAAQHVPEEQQ